jgi:murein DD-endopeptidase MepM/ murein hydrolase activator NlpD
VWALLVSLCLIPPVDGPVESRFVAPACPFCPGNRAVDFRSEPGDEVVSPASGTIHFSGPVAGVGYVTVRVAGRLVTVGGLDSIPGAVRRGRVVSQGSRLGAAAGDSVSLSLRVVSQSGAVVHVDPETHLGRRRRRRARLVPLGFRPVLPVGSRGVCSLTR